jgi:hypothetical protein
MRVDYRLDEHPVCPALYKLPGERMPAWSCQCRRPDGRRLLRNHRHASEAECLPQSEIDAWRATSGCGPRTAREWYWMWKTFATSLTARGA